jgi:hypothetical protein
MPAGSHEILETTRQAVERRAHVLLAQLQELGNEAAIKAAHAGAPDDDDEPALEGSRAP